MKCLIKEKLSEHKYRDNNGYLICVDSVLARTGKQRYLRSEIFADAADDDSEIEVDRKPEEVFSEKTLASFENCPLCVEHPDEDVNPDNYKDYAVGFVRDVHKGNVDGQDVILGTLVITDGKTIEEVENGQHTDLSCGYDCDIDDSENPQQRNIRGNHVALCEQGRAGNARIVDSKKVKDSERYIIYRNSGAGEMIYEGSDLKDVIEEIKSLGRNYYIIDTKDGYKKITYSEAIKMKLDSVKDEDIFKVDVSSAEDRDVSRFITEAQNIGFITDDTGYIIYLKHGNRDMLNQLKARTHTINIKFFDSYNGYYDEKEKDNWNNGYAYYFEDDDDYYRALKQVKASGQKILATGVEAGPNGRQYFVLKDSIKDSKYIVHFKHKNGGGDKDIIVEAKGMADAVEIAKTYVSDFYYKYVNVKPYFEDSYKDYQSTKESFERIEEMPRTARKWVGETSNKKAGLLAIENGIEDIINSADPSIREELRRRGDKIIRDLKSQFGINDSVKDNFYYKVDESRLRASKDFKLKEYFKDLDEAKRKPISIDKENEIHDIKEKIEKRVRELEKVPNDIFDSIKDATYTIQQHNGKWYYEIKEDDGFTHLVGPYTSMEEAIMYFKKHRPNETLTDEESTAEKVTKNLEKNFENFKETRMKDDSDLSLLKEYFKEKQPSRKMELRNKLRSMGYKEGVSGVNSRELMWVELNGKKYEVKNLSSVTPLDSIKDSTFVIRYKDLYNDIKHEEEINANSINEAIELLKKAVGLRGIGTANVYVERIENKSSREYYPRAYGKLNSLTVDSNKLKDDMKVVSKWFKTSGNTPVSSAILQNKEGYTFYSGIIREDKDFQTLQQAEEYAKILGYTKDSCKKDSLVNIIKVAKVVKKYGK